jgi:uncharacterized protein DUF4190
MAARASAAGRRRGRNEPPRRSGKALAALICGVVGLFLIPLLAPIAAIVLGRSAQREMREARGGLAGWGMAQAGIVMGWIGIAIAGAIVALAIAGSL